MAPDPIADDDQSIGDDVVLWRGITPEQIKPDGAASDGAFRTKEMSVFIAVETDRAAVLAKLRPGTRLRRSPRGTSGTLGESSDGRRRAGPRSTMTRLPVISSSVSPRNPVRMAALSASTAQSFDDRGHPPRRGRPR